MEYVFKIIRWGHEGSEFRGWLVLTYAEFREHLDDS